MYHSGKFNCLDCCVTFFHSIIHSSIRKTQYYVK